MTTVKRIKTTSGLTLSILLLLSGCKGAIDDDQQEDPELSAQLEPLRMTNTSLKEISSAGLENLIKNGIRLTAQSRLDNPPHLEVFTDSSEGTPINWLSELPEGHAANQRAIFSSPYWFVSSSNARSSSRVVIEDTTPGFHILKVDSDRPEFQLVNKVELDPGLGKLDALFQVHNTGDKQYISTLRNFVTDRYLSSDIFKDGFVLVDGEEIESTYHDIFYHKAPMGTIEITLNDVTNPESPQVNRTLKIDGRLSNVRQIGNSLYLVTEYIAWIDNLYSILDPSRREIDEDLVASTNLNSLLPQYSVESQKQPLFDKCLTPENLKGNSAHHSVLSLIEVDLTTATINSALCFAGPGHSTSTFTDEAFYFSTPINYDEKLKSAVFKVDLTQERPQLIANGIVEGRTGFTGAINTQMSEWNNVLHVLSSEYVNSRYQYYLTYLTQEEGQLKVINQSQSSQWGPWLDEFQFRISQLFITKNHLLFGSRASGVGTYYISLNEPSRSQITRLLDAEYYVERVQTIGDDLLLVMGYKSETFPDRSGLWVGLFHTNDDPPTLIDSIHLGGEGTSASVWIPDEVSFFRADDHMRIAFPITFASGRDSTSTWEYAGSQFLEIHGLPSLSASSSVASDYNDITIQDAGALKTETEPYDRYFASRLTDNRALLDENAVYLYRHSAFWSTAWSSPENIVGPVTSDIDGCGELNPSVLVTINVPETSEANACDTLVTVDAVYNSYTLAPSGVQGKSCVFSGPPNEMGGLKITGKLEGFKQVGDQIHASRDRCTSLTETVSFDLVEQPIL